MNIWLAPYPSPLADGVKRKIISSSIIGVFIFLFLLFFRPLGISESNDYRNILFIFGFGVITFSVCILFLVLIPSLLERLFRSSTWNLWKAIVHISILIFTIAICNILYILVLHKLFVPSAHEILYLIAGTFVIGVIPAAFGLLIDYQKSTIKYHKEGKSMELPVENQVTSDKIVTFTSKYDEEPVSVSLAHLLFVEAEGNYITIHMKGRRKIMLRNSLTNVQELFHGVESVLKTHRSYLVNMDQVTEVSGNAQGYELSFGDYSALARVSRANTKMVKKILA